MGFLRRHREERTRYTLRERLLAIGDDYWIENADGERVLKVDGKALRVRKTLVVQAPSGEELFTVRERKLSLRDKVTIDRHGETIATVRKALVSPLRERYHVDVHGGGELKARGNIVDHEYKIDRGGRTIAEISKRWFRMRDTYAIEIVRGEDDALIIATALAIDQMAHEERDR